MVEVKFGVSGNRSQELFSWSEISSWEHVKASSVFLDF